MLWVQKTIKKDASSSNKKILTRQSDKALLSFVSYNFKVLLKKYKNQTRVERATYNII